MEENEAYCYYLQDDLGSPMQLVDEDGLIMETYGFDEFGMELSIDNIVQVNANRTNNKTTTGLHNDRLQPFSFTGCQMDEAGEMYFAQARRYDAIAGRFVSEDIKKGKIYSLQTLNVYKYCKNNPLMFIDLNGKEEEYVYDRDAAIEYAERWTRGGKGINSYLEWWQSDEYRNVEEYNSHPSNCANFVSQCLFAGGVEETEVWNTNENIVTDYWYGGSGNLCVRYERRGDDSAAWMEAKDQFEYFSNPYNGYTGSTVITIDSVDEIQVALDNNIIQKGDLMFFENDTGIFHATIISSVDESMIYYAGNSSKQFDKALKDGLGSDSVKIVIMNDVIDK